MGRNLGNLQISKKKHTENNHLQMCLRKPGSRPATEDMTVRSLTLLQKNPFSQLIRAADHR